MELVADILLIAGALGAAFYCVVLSRRLSRFTSLDRGMGGAIAVLSAQVDEMTRALGNAKGSAETSTDSLQHLTERAEGVAQRLELLVAAMHDLPGADDPIVGSAPVSESVAVDAPLPADAFRSRRTWAREAAE